MFCLYKEKFPLPLIGLSRSSPLLSPASPVLSSLGAEPWATVHDVPSTR